MKSMKRLLLAAMLVAFAFAFTACSTTVTPSVNFGFKNIDTAAEYNESLSVFEVGKRFYCCIKLQLTTDKKAPQDYRVEVIVPKTNQVEMKEMGGLSYDSINWDEDNERSIVTYTVRGYKEAIPEKLLFSGTPTQDGEAKIEIHIYDQENNEVNSGYYRRLYFDYEVVGE